jgi:hypothetical protein
LNQSFTGDRIKERIDTIPEETEHENDTNFAMKSNLPENQSELFS